jgi:signal transduction histidine kinase
MTLPAGQELRSLVNLPTFRLTLFYSLLFGFSTLLLFSFIYWQTALIETARVDQLLIRNVEFLARENGPALTLSLESRLMPDLRQLTYAAVWDRERRRLAGNFPLFPEDLLLDGRSHPLFVAGRAAPDGEMIRAVGLRLDEGAVLVIGRTIDSIDNLQHVVIHALELGLVPAILLSIAAGAMISQRTHRQLQRVHITAERILRGDLCERLPTRGNGDDLDRLAGSVNLMLDEIARLMDDMKSASDNIAHDLRTPLTRVRTRLERARETATTQEELQKMVDRAIIGLDQALRLITALLRIGEIEGGRRRAAFEPVDLAVLAREIQDLYEPFAEEKAIRFIVSLAPVPLILGDPDLLCELLSNLVDNAIKFTAPGGQVSIALRQCGASSLLTVSDNGPGIPPDQREMVFQRFYRSDASRSVVGYGLGLSLVNAIAKLHRFQVNIADNHPGAIFELRTSISQN